MNKNNQSYLKYIKLAESINKNTHLKKTAGIAQMGGTFISRTARNRKAAQMGGKKILGSFSHTRTPSNLSDASKSFSLKRVGTGVALGGLAGAGLYATV